MVLTLGGGIKQLDVIFKSIPSMQGLRHFERGISNVSQWTGREVKQIERVILGVVYGLTMPLGKSVKAVKALVAFLTYIYLSHQQNISDTGINLMKTMLYVFHENKDVFLGGKALCLGFNGIPKFHLIQHYPFSISEFGTCDGYSTSTFERCHIDLAKIFYCQSNRVNYLPQMTKNLQRQDSLYYHAEYLR